MSRTSAVNTDLVQLKADNLDMRERLIKQEYIITELRRRLDVERTANRGLSDRLSTLLEFQAREVERVEDELLCTELLRSEEESSEESQ
jgi:flagellin-specific chaperone FliS